MKTLFIGLLAFIASIGTVVYTNTDLPKQKRIVILLGAPGSGKGTQAKEISKKAQYPPYFYWGSF